MTETSETMVARAERELDVLRARGFRVLRRSTLDSLRDGVFEVDLVAPASLPCEPMIKIFTTREGGWFDAASAKPIEIEA